MPARSARTAACRAIYRKHFLPNYGVFDEHRYFAEGRDLLLLRMGDVYAGPTICEDLWQPGPPATDLALAGAQLVVNLSASPYHVGKAEEREEMLVTRARDTSSYLAFCNLVGGQDELVFDGHSVVLDDAGEVVARAPGFEEHLLVVDVEPDLAIGRRLRDVRRRELDRSRESVPAVDIVELASAASPRGADRPRGDAVRARARADAPRARPRAARLRREERVRARRRRSLRRDRLRGDRGALRRRLRPGARPLRLDAIAVLSEGTRRTRAGSPRASAATSARSRSRTSSRSSGARSPSRRAGSKGSPRRTCRRASAE